MLRHLKMLLFVFIVITGRLHRRGRRSERICDCGFGKAGWTDCQSLVGQGLRFSLTADLFNLFVLFELMLSMALLLVPATGVLLLGVGVILSWMCGSGENDGYGCW